MTFIYADFHASLNSHLHHSKKPMDVGYIFLCKMNTQKIHLPIPVELRVNQPGPCNGFISNDHYQPQ